MRRQKKLLLLMALLLVGCITTFSLVSMRATAQLGDDAQWNSSGASSGPVQMIRFTLYDAAILPREVHVEKGRVMVVLEDRSGGASELLIERETGNGSVRAGGVRRAENHRRGRSELRLTPGRYQVYDPNRPDYRALLVVEP